ncbi:hypothetical protein BDR06DRAFT_1015035 [Suillus hirtellus]|nr:hypothetical protein BDR06DRAFT_1015035 [Suillus hirtellus]
MFNTRLSPYATASPHALRSSEVHDIQELEWGIKASLKSYQLELQRRGDHVGTRKGSDMDIDLPMRCTSGTYGCVDTAMEDDETRSLAIVPVGNVAGCESEGYQSPKKRRLVRGLQKTVDRYIQRHLETNDPRTDHIRKRMHIALQAALLCTDIDDMLVQTPRDENKPKFQPTDDYLVPHAVAYYIVNGVTSGLRSLGIALSTALNNLKTITGTGSTIPGESPDAETMNI